MRHRDTGRGRSLHKLFAIGGEMNRARQGFRLMALTAAVLLLWCHGLGLSLHGHSESEGVRAVISIDPMDVPALPGSHTHTAVNCCQDGTGSGLQVASLTPAPTPSAPVLTALLSMSLFLVVASRIRPVRDSLAAHRRSLVDQSVLIRI